MQEINVWLKSGKDFEVGKSLYVKYGTNSFFKSLLNNQGATPYNLKKLGAELKVLASAPPAIVIDASPISIVADPLPTPVKEEAGKVGPPDQEPAPTGNTADYPKHLQLKQHLKNTYRQLERSCTDLDIGTNLAMLKLCAQHILSLHQKVQDSWKLIDYYDAEDRFPEVAVEIIRTPAEKIQLRRQSTSKAKKRLDSGTCRDIPATQDLIAKNNKRIIELGGKVKS